MDRVAEWDLGIDVRNLESLRRNPRQFVRGTLRVAGSPATNVAFKLKGASGSFRPLDDKPSWTLDFSRFEQGRTLDGVSRVHLNNSFEDPSLLNEILGTEMFREAGLPAPRTAHTLVRLNGRRLGLYVLQEAVTEEFQSSELLPGRFAVFEEDLPAIEPAGKPPVSQGVPDQLPRALLLLRRALAENVGPSRLQALAPVLDMDQFLGFIAMEVMLSHRDGYALARNNFRLLIPVGGGTAVFVPHGMDQLFGLPELSWKPAMAGTLARAVLESSLGEARYEATFRALFQKVFDQSRWSARIDGALSGLQPFATGEEWKTLNHAAEVLRGRMKLRRVSLAKQLQQSPLIPMEFRAGEAPLRGWRTQNSPEPVVMDELTDQTGQVALHVKAGPKTSVSWAAEAVVPQGRYQFVARIRTRGVLGLPFGRAHGATLRIAGRESSLAGLLGDTDGWQRIALDFEVREPRERLTFLCELRAAGGEAWFRLEDLKLVRVQ